MKKNWIMAVIIPGLFAVPAFSQTGAAFRGSPHDFSNTAAGKADASPGASCKICHLVREKSSSSLLAGMGTMSARMGNNQQFSTYTLMDGTRIGQPSGVSKMCLSCHDGTVAIDEWDGRGGGNQNGMVRPGGGHSMDLTRTHPVSVPYKYNPTDIDGLNDPRGTFMGTAGYIADFLPDGKVECTSCHDVHGRETVRGTPLLRAPMRRSQGAASGLCLSCHRK